MAKIKKIHFIGIGGVGMSGIALVANEQGLIVSGSDMRKSYMTDLLENAGIEVMIGQRAENIKDPDVVVISTAILDNNPELCAAKEKGVEIWHRAQMLAYLGRDLKTLACAGTHGKTSTSSMLASVMDTLGEDPTFLIGGVVRQYDTNARSGRGKYYVVEADESDKSFKYIDPFSAIVTNIEADHLDHYSDLDEIYEKFEEFIKSINPKGAAVVCGEDAKLTEIAKRAHNNVLTYGFGDCDYKITDYKVQGVGCSFKINNIPCSLKQNPGKHYALNATAVIALLDFLSFDIEKAAQAMSFFAGIKRRFDLVGEENGITVVDDYAHHSTEIAATVKAACSLDFKNVHVIWQPHRYSRAKLLTEIYHDEFAHAFDGCKTVTITDVYAAGETPIPGVTGETFYNVVCEGTAKPYYVEHRNDIVDHMVSLAKPGDLVITMGAGDITSKGPQILAKIKESNG